MFGMESEELRHRRAPIGFQPDRRSTERMTFHGRGKRFSKLITDASRRVLEAQNTMGSHSV